MHRTSLIRALTAALLVCISLLIVAACETQPETINEELQNEVAQLREDFDAFTEEWGTFRDEWGTFREGLEAGE